LDDTVGDLSAIFKDIARRYAKGFNPLRYQPGIALRVFLRSIATVVRLAVDFYG
jgi:hypothetical protein